MSEEEEEEEEPSEEHIHVHVVHSDEHLEWSDLHS